MDADSDLIFEEKDETFSCYVTPSKSEEYIFIGSYSTLTTEFQFLDAGTPLEDFQLIQERIPELEYSISHYKDHFYIFTNADGAKNYKVMKTPVDQTDKPFWKEVLPHRDHVLLEDLELFNDYWVVVEREQGLSKIHVHTWDESEDYYLPLRRGNIYRLPNHQHCF